ncbi:aryl-sulfate sulfotransferase [Microbulbifer epialgicus]|uniref:Aryl-sulfate sulfotransferase n=1 Tax=Microbulbifer epialgicus TaxID=393907 RepID=A0ABV4P544_9GAMM
MFQSSLLAHFLIIVILSLYGCGGSSSGDDDIDPGNGGLDTPSDGSSDGGDDSGSDGDGGDDAGSNEPAQLILSPHPENTLMVNASVITEENAKVVIKFESEATEPHQVTLNEFSTEHSSTIVGLRASTTYQFTTVSTYENGNVVESEPVDFTTGGLPSGVPATEVVTHTAQSEGGITIFAPATTNSGRFWGVDEEGEVVWYLHDDVPLSGTPAARYLGDGRIMLLLNSEARIITFAGETLQTYDLPPYHHDAILLDTGNLLVLTYQRQTIGNSMLQGDVIVEIDPKGNTVWRWSAFDHLDTNRFPGGLSTHVSDNGSMDWTHSNSLFYQSDDDTIMISSRSQSWVINIDHKTGEVVWIMGDSDGNTVDNLENKFLSLTSGSWMASQHAAMLTDNGQVLIYDNRNEAELSGDIHNSRAVRYNINTNQMTAEQDWEFITPKYTQSLDDVDELDNGNILITAGGPSTPGSGGGSTSHIIEVTPNSPSTAVWEMEVNQTFIYRTERIKWQELEKFSSLEN